MEEWFTMIWKDYKPFVVILTVIVFIRTVVVKLYKKRKDLKKKDKFVIGVNNLFLISFAVWTFLLSLHLAGITIREFFTSITIIAAAVAIVFREYILNGLNGMLFLIGDHFQIGDYIKVGEEKGYVTDLTLMHVHLKNDEDNLVLLPNNNVAASTVINYTRNPRHFSVIDFQVRSIQSVDFDLLRKALEDALENYKDEIRPDSIALKVVEVKEDMVLYRFRFGVKKYEHSRVTEMKQQLYRNLLRVLPSARIEK